MCIAAVNAAYGHIFCGMCNVQAWIHSIDLLYEASLQCPVCRAELLEIEDLQLWNLLDMLSRCDQNVEWVVKPMMDNIQRAVVDVPRDLL
jgi:hypothetical protein